MPQKKKINIIKIKNLCSLKDTLIEMKAQATIWEKIIARFLLEKGLECRIYFKTLRVSLVAQQVKSPTVSM